FGAFAEEPWPLVEEFKDYDYCEGGYDPEDVIDLDGIVDDGMVGHFRLLFLLLLFPSSSFNDTIAARAQQPKLPTILMRFLPASEVAARRSTRAAHVAQNSA